MESWINAREGASENPTNVRFSQGGEKQKNPTRSSFFPTKNQGLEWMSSNPRMQIAHFFLGKNVVKDVVKN